MVDRKALALIRRRRATRPLMKRVPVQAQPDNIAREYARTLDGLIKTMHTRTAVALVNAYPTRQDAVTATIGRAVEGARIDSYQIITERRAGLIAQGVGKRVHRFTEGAITDQVKAVIGVNPLATVKALNPSLLDNFAQANVSLIRTVQERYFGQVSALAQESVAIGRRAEDFSALLQERGKVAEFNADRIARDQVSKLNAMITETRHRDLGIAFYFWRTSNDERVRETHEANNGERFSYDDPPAETGNPGDDVQCRCRAEPDLSAFFA